MLGEMDKVVPASTHRFREVQAGEWALSGAPNESVIISFVAKGAIDASTSEWRHKELFCFNFCRLLTVEFIACSSRDGKLRAK